MVPFRPQGYADLSVYFGDLHNHCGLSYGHGSLTDALHNARLQLDFTSVTVHAVWPDLPTDDPYLRYLVDYHREGFAKAKAAWTGYLQMIDGANQDQNFVTFPSFEWHSMRYGDHCVYYQHGGYQHGGNESAEPPIVEAQDLPELRRVLQSLPTPAILIPHHIGYRQGYRGIDWDAFTEDLSPVAEIFSFHGLSESSEGPYPYLHSMGPRHKESTAQYGWARGHIFGVVASTDHHNAFPGSYGYGRLGVWAESLSRYDIWAAIEKRRTYALTGDRIVVEFSINGQPMGSQGEATEERWLEARILGSDSIDYVEVLHNNRLIHRESILPESQDQGVFTVFLEVGWGERAEEVLWDVTVQVANGQLQRVEPRFRGFGPTDSLPPEQEVDYTNWRRVDDDCVWFSTRTRQNPSLHTAATEGLALAIEGDVHTRLVITANGQRTERSVGELLSGADVVYQGGFVSPALCLHRAIPKSELTHRFAFLHRNRSHRRDWYYLRVRQRNNQWAWTSPIWVNGYGD